MTISRVWETLFDATPVGASATITSPVVRNRLKTPTELIMQVTSVASAVPDVRVEHAVSNDGVTFTGYDFTDIVASSLAEFVVTEGLTRVALPAITSPYFRIRTTELTGAVADTLVTMRLQSVEEVGR